MKILLTGFNSFRGVRRNPSEYVVREIARRAGGASPAMPGVELVAEVLPTEYAQATTRLRRLIREERPDAVLCLGVAPRRTKISLERAALNLDDEPTPDNAGVVRRGGKIAARGPDLYWSSLPLAAIEKEFARLRIPAYISNHAGAFLCNHVFYIARMETSRRGIPCGFLHLPGGPAGRRDAALRRSVRAVEICLRLLARHARH